MPEDCLDVDRNPDEGVDEVLGWGLVVIGGTKGVSEGAVTVLAGGVDVLVTTTVGVGAVDRDTDRDTETSVVVMAWVILGVKMYSR